MLCPLLMSCFATVVCNEWIIVASPPHPIIISRGSRSGASGQTSGQWLTYFVRPSWRNDRSSPTWVDGEEEEAEGPHPIPSLRLSATLLSSAHPPNRKLRSCKCVDKSLRSQLICTRWLPLPGQLFFFFFFQREESSLHIGLPTAPPFYAGWAAVPQSVLPLAQHDMTEALWGNLWRASEEASHNNVSFG